jgi:hypothetical protein
MCSGPLLHTISLCIRRSFSDIPRVRIKVMLKSAQMEDSGDSVADRALPSIKFSIRVH